MSEQSFSKVRILFPQLGFGYREGCRKVHFADSDYGHWFSDGGRVRRPICYRCGVNNARYAL